MKLLAIIPARGGSKRVPGKNKTDFFGKPMIAYTIEAAIESKIFTDIVVSSEDREIVEFSGQFNNVSVLKRPEELATDQASVMDVVNHVLDIKGDDYDYVFIMLPSTPMRTYQDIVNVYEMLKEKRPNCVMSVTDYLFEVIYAYTLDEEGFLTRRFPEMSGVKSQEAQKHYVDNGGIYALRPEFLRARNYCPEETYPYFMPIWASVDIDTPQDLEIAKAMYSYFVKGNNGA
jgi:CMP-N-acetylneuraminic acid synthetase